MSRVRSQFPQSLVVAAFAACLLSLLALAPTVAAKGVVSTFGGLGEEPGLFSDLDGLRGLSVNQTTGDVYVVDGGNQRVQRFTGSGAFVSQLGGSAGTTGGLFTNPFGVAVNSSDGSVYVTDGGNLRVQKFAGAGGFVSALGFDTIQASAPSNVGTDFEVCTTASDCKAGTSGAGDGQFGSVFNGHLGVDPAGSVYVADPVNRRVQRFNGSTGAFEGAFGTSAIFGANSPSRIAVGTTGIVYALDVGGRRVQKCTPSGSPPAVTATCVLLAPAYATNRVPVAIAVNPANDNVLVARRNGAATGEVVIDEFTSAGTPVATHGEGSGIGVSVAAASMNASAGLAINASNGKIYLSVPVTTGNSRPEPLVFVYDNAPPMAATIDDATEITATGATLTGTVTPAALPLRTSYRFEYSTNGVTWTQAPTVELGDGSGSGDPDSCPVGNPSSCNVSQDVSGLQPGQTYQFRLVAFSQYNGSSTIVNGSAFQTPSATAPSLRNVRAWWSSPADTDPSLTLAADIAPNGSATTYRFEYVDDDSFADSGYDEAASAPAKPVYVASGLLRYDVLQSAFGLDASKTYHYRLVATNAVGPTAGADHVIDPPQDDDRYYELVSVGDSQGIGVLDGNSPLARALASDDGDKVLFGAQAFGDQGSSLSIDNPFLAERGPDGWKVGKSLNIDPDYGYGVPGGNNVTISSDLSRVLWPSRPTSQAARGEIRWTFAEPGGLTVPASPLLVPVDIVGNYGNTPDMTYLPMGASHDLSTFVFVPTRRADTGVTFVPGEPMVVGFNANNLYQVTGAGTDDAKVSVVSRATDGSFIGGACGAALGAIDPLSNGAPTATDAVSADGSIVYFSARPGTPDGVAPAYTCSPTLPVRVFKRVNDATTLAVSVSQCSRVSPACSSVDGDDYYWGASKDGSKVFFSSPRQLTNADLDTTDDLYAYDASPPAGQPNLVLASGGEVTGGHPTVGSGAKVAGVSVNADDGSRVYFVARGQLTAEATAGANNLYVFQRDADHPTGRLEFVARLDSGATDIQGKGDSDLWGRTTIFGGKPVFARPAADGHLLFFVSQRAILAEDGDDVDDLYRYDDDGDELVCLSCAGDAQLPVAVRGRLPSSSDPSAEQRDRFVSDDGDAVVFQTREALAAADRNGVVDVYLVRGEGEPELITGGAGRIGVKASRADLAAANGADPDARAVAAGISRDGLSVYFTSTARLAADDGNQVPDVYVARVGGGFPAVPAPPSCEALEGVCQGNGSGPVGSGRRTGSGGGNLQGERVSLSVGALSAAQRRAAAKSGKLTLRVKTSAAGRLTAVARGRIAGRTRRVGHKSLRAQAGTARLTLRLSRPARAVLGRGRALRVSVRVTASGARPRAMRIVLRRES